MDILCTHTANKSMKVVDFSLMLPVMTFRSLWKLRQTGSDEVRLQSSSMDPCSTQFQLHSTDSTNPTWFCVRRLADRSLSLCVCVGPLWIWVLVDSLGSPASRLPLAAGRPIRPLTFVLSPNLDTPGFVMLFLFKCKSSSYAKFCLCLLSGTFSHFLWSVGTSPVCFLFPTGGLAERTPEGETEAHQVFITWNKREQVKSEGDVWYLDVVLQDFDVRLLKHLTKLLITQQTIHYHDFLIWGFIQILTLEFHNFNLNLYCVVWKSFYTHTHTHRISDLCDFWRHLKWRKILLLQELDELRPLRSQRSFGH